MRLPAPEGTPQVTTPGVARVGQEKDPVMPAAGQAAPQTRLGPQRRTQYEVVFQDQIAHFVPPIPVPAKLEMLLDLDGKKPRL